MKTIEDAARAAINAQSACNLSGVVHSFSGAMSILRAHPECTGTEWANKHPISILFATQVAWLAHDHGESETALDVDGEEHGW